MVTTRFSCNETLIPLSGRNSDRQPHYSSWPSRFVRLTSLLAFDAVNDTDTSFCGGSPKGLPPSHTCQLSLFFPDSWSLLNTSTSHISTRAPGSIFRLPSCSLFHVRLDLLDPRWISEWSLLLLSYILNDFADNSHVLPVTFRSI